MHPEHDRERRVDAGEGLEDARVPRLREALAAVFLGHVEAAEAALAELADDVVADPPLLLDLSRVEARPELVSRGDEGSDLVLLAGIRLGPGEDELLVDVAEEQGLRKR
jgi:hypothetical protein